jgi:hypothetical protein
MFLNHLGAGTFITAHCGRPFQLKIGGYEESPVLFSTGL